MRAFVLLALFASPLVSAQTAAPGRLTYVSLAVGAAGGFQSSPNTTGFLGGSTTGPSLAVDLHVVRNALHMQPGASAQVFGVWEDQVVEGHLLVGTGHSFGPVILTAAAGPALAYVVRSIYEPPARSRIGQEEGVVPGLHASVGAMAVVVPEVAFGIEAFGHLNARTPIAGLRLTAALGRLPGAFVR